MRPATTSRCSVADSIRVLARVLAPTLAGGVIKRRPAVMRIAGLLRPDHGAIAEVRRLRDRYGPDPVLLRVPGRSIAMVLSGADVGQVLAGTPDPFTPATRDKTGALAHFQPHGVLISKGAERAARRAFNEQVLETPRPLHHLAAPIREVILEDTGRLLEGRRTLDWPAFDEAWWRIVRRIVLGAGARDDTAVTDELDRLRRRANWGAFAPRDDRLRASFESRVRRHLAAADPNSLAGVVAGTPVDDPVSQLAHWLFAFDAAGMVTMRTLAVLSTHATHLTRARAELDSPLLPYLRACVLDTVRLWPTTPALLRETEREAKLGNTVLPARTQLLIFTPYFHRDPAELPYADVFTPDIWLDGRAEDNPALVPFSGGPAECPGKNLVLLTTSTTLAALLRDHTLDYTGPQDLDPRRPLPATVDNFSMRFLVAPR